MDRNLALREIAQTGYNVGYGAKKHLATFDIVEKAPGWISIASFAAGILALVVPAFEDKLLAAIFLIIAYAVFYFNSYQENRTRYAEVGSRLTALSHSLRGLYYEVQSRPANSPIDDLMDRYQLLVEEHLRIGISKQIFLSDWYAHYKFFWQHQIGWMDEQLKFRFWRDKVPLSASLFAGLSLLALAAWLACGGGWRLCG
ncbi:MAG: SLATT domain-containing protein [Lysobacter sp.]|nr:MAG: SLATT domain-containing protein [Lysobacter sp.]